MNLYRSNLTNIVRAPGTIALGLGVWAYILFGWGAALLKAVFVILLVIAILVIALLIRILYIMKQMAQANSATPSISAAVRIMAPRIAP